MTAAIKRELKFQVIEQQSIRELHDSVNATWQLEGKIDKIEILQKQIALYEKFIYSLSTKTSTVFLSREDDMDLVAEAIEEITGIPAHMLKIKSRRGLVVEARHLFCFMLATYSSMNLAEIGRYLGGRDHTTVIHGRERIKSDLTIYSHTKENLRKVLMVVAKRKEAQHEAAAA